MREPEEIDIMVVEDNPGDARLLEAMLVSSMSGLAVVHRCETIEKAMVLADEQSPDVAILDLSLPDAMGLEGVIKLSQKNPDLAIVVLTGLDDEELSRDALRLGAQDYLHKNDANPQSLCRTLRYAIERQELANALRNQVEELDAARQRFRSLIEDSADAMLVIDEDGRVQFGNRAAEELLARPLDELIGEPVGIPFDGRSDSGLDLFRPDGKRIIIDMRVVQTLWNEEEAYIATFRDVTDQRRTERALRIAKQAAESSSRMKSAFLASMSHELRTPLNGILGYSEAIMHELYGSLNNGKYVEYIHSIHESGRHLLGLINDLLDHSKIEAGEFAINGGVARPIDAIDEAIEGIKPNADAKNIRIEEDLSPDALLELQADGFRLRQVMLNLLSNAVKFSPQGGTITVGCDLNRQGDIQMTVADNGPGIPPEQIHKALAPFGQVDNPYTKAPLEGTGLGLPLSKRLVELHGGDLRIRSTQGGGTTVVVTLPASRIVHSDNDQDDAEDILGLQDGCGQLGPKS